VKRLPGERPSLEGLRVLYADLDGTILGPGGSLFAAEDGSVSGRAPAALQALHAAGVELVLMSGRTRRGMHEPARILGARAYIAELGAFLVELEGEQVTRNFGAFRGDGSPVEAIARSGAGAYLLDRFPRRLLPVAPWTEATMMFHGHVDPEEATRALVEGGYRWLGFDDNGRLRRTYPDLDVAEVHAYHLLPHGVSKASAVRLHRERHGIAPSHAAAVGDSPSDLPVAREVGAFFLVANGLPSAGPAADRLENAYVTTASHGEGFAEAVDALLGK